MEKPDTHLVDTALKMGAEIIGVELHDDVGR